MAAFKWRSFQTAHIGRTSTGILWGMVTGSPHNLSELPDSLYADELRRATLSQPFTAKLEAEYVRSRLMHNRALIRVALALAILLTLLRGVEQATTASWSAIRVSCLTLVVAGSAVLLWIACRSAFERLYLPWARIIVPLRNVIVAALIAEFASRGQPDLLMILPLMLIAPFFFLGLQLRGALMCGLLTVASGGASAILFGLALPVALRSITLQLAALLGCAFAARLTEKASRTGYLHNRLTAEMAQRDALTGAKNRRIFDQHLAQLWQQALENRRTMVILLLDVDHFKKYNDCYGHQAGDHALRQVAQTAQAFIRGPQDVFARYGGEEFAAILYDVDGSTAAQIADQIRFAVEALAIVHVASATSTVVTISVGVAVIKPTAARKPCGALQLADQALYEAKVEGRNRIKVMDETQYRWLVTGAFVKHIGPPAPANSDAAALVRSRAQR